LTIAILGRVPNATALAARLYARGALTLKENWMFHTYDEWEGRGGSKVIGALFEQPGLRRYQCFQVPINLQLFHIDVGTGGDEKLDWSRWIFSNFDDVLDFLLNEHVTKVRISLQTRRLDDQSYEIIRIREILTVLTKDDRSGYIFVGVNGSRYPDSYWDPVVDSNIEVIESLWVLDEG
jgi:hypothetical protein